MCVFKNIRISDFFLTLLLCVRALLSVWLGVRMHAYVYKCVFLSEFVKFSPWNIGDKIYLSYKRNYCHLMAMECNLSFRWNYLHIHWHCQRYAIFYLALSPFSKLLCTFDLNIQVWQQSNIMCGQTVQQLWHLINYLPNRTEAFSYNDCFKQKKTWIERKIKIL